MCVCVHARVFLHERERLFFICRGLCLVCTARQSRECFGSCNSVYIVYLGAHCKHFQLIGYKHINVCGEGPGGFRGPGSIYSNADVCVCVCPCIHISAGKIYAIKAGNCWVLQSVAAAATTSHPSGISQQPLLLCPSQPMATC